MKPRYWIDVAILVFTFHWLASALGHLPTARPDGVNMWWVIAICNFAGFCWALAHLIIATRKTQAAVEPQRARA